MTGGTTVRDEAPSVLERYRALLRDGAVAGGHPVGRVGPDELLTGAEGVRAGSKDLAASVDLLGVDGLVERLREAGRLVEDDGVTYGTAEPDAPLRPGGEGVDAGDSDPPLDAAGDSSGTRPWVLDPLPVVVDAPEWERLSAGLVQRAEVLDAVLADLYGPRDLLRHGIVPPEVVFGHSGFLRQADQVRLPGPRQLFHLATDLARGEDGRWFVIGDRTQAPSGAGYAMENRRIISRIMPGLYRDTPTERLRQFFDRVRTGLQEVAPPSAEAPRVVLLTPGSGSETAFDQAFLSMLLGYPLVEGRDLTVRGGRVWLRSLGRLEPVDVVMRRVDNWFCDPLELRPDSHLGVPGLLEAARRGTVSVVNTLGSGVLENPGLLPFLPAAAQYLLDGQLTLPSTPTWWCGDRVSRSHVTANLERLVVRPISRGRHGGSRLGWQQSAAQLDVLRRRIADEPHAWCGQEPLGMSTVPAVTTHGLEPRRMVLRTFAVAEGGRYRLMAGGLARVAARSDSHDTTSRSGAVAKDVWVRSPQTVAADGTRVISTPGSDAAPVVAVGIPLVSARVASDLYWLGRYAERAEDAARLLRVVSDVAEDHSRRPGSAGAQSLNVLLTALTQVTTTYPGFVGQGAEQRLNEPQGELMRLTVDANRPGSLAHAVRRTVDAANAVREQLSQDTWLVLGSLDRRLGDLAARASGGVVSPTDVPLQSTFGQVLEGLLALAGLAGESMVRDTGWYFMDAGRRVERSLHLVALLRRTLHEARAGAVDDLVIESVLIATESVITHRRRHPGQVSVETVLDLLLLDRANPRALVYQLDRLAEALRHLPGGAADESAERGVQALVRDLQAVLREGDVGLLDRRRDLLVDLLDDAASRLLRIGDTLSATHFTLGLPQQPLAGSAVMEVR